MLNKEQLEAVLFELSEEVTWFYTKLSISVSPTDLLYLSKPYTDKVSKFIESHTYDELRQIDPEDFIEQATDEKLTKVLKMVEVEKKKQSIEQDFV